MVKCDYCGKAIQGFPYKCSYCGGTFCGEHHLPENHECVKIDEAMPPYAKKSQSTFSLEEDDNEFKRRLRVPIFPFRKEERDRDVIRRGFKFSRKELIHLSIAAVLTALVALSLYGWNFQNLFRSSFLIGIILPSFLLHELAHKFTAQYFGIWAEFRLILFGALLTFFSVFLPLKFLAPGAVMITSFTSREEAGKISIAGPLVNVSLGSLFLFFFFLPLWQNVGNIFRIGVYLNGFIAVFNLLPFGPLDGKKVLSWNKALWGATLGVAGVLMAFGIFF